MYPPKPTMPRKTCVSFLIVSGEIAAVLLIIFIGIWQCPSCHFAPKKWIPCAGHLTLLLFMAKPDFRRIWTIFFTFLKKIFYCVAPHDNVINVLKVFCSFTPFHCSLDQPMANGRAAFPPWGSWFQVYWTPLQVRANCGLYSAAKGIEKNTLSIVACNLAAFDSSLKF